MDVNYLSALLQHESEPLLLIYIHLRVFLYYLFKRLFSFLLQKLSKLRNDIVWIFAAKNRLELVAPAVSQVVVVHVRSVCVQAHVGEVLPELKHVP